MDDKSGEVKDEMTEEEIIKAEAEIVRRIPRWSELAAARDAENRCWTPPHAGHIKRALDDHKAVLKCKEKLEELRGKK